MSTTFTNVPASSKYFTCTGNLQKQGALAIPHPSIDIGYRDINPGDKCEKGSQLRPHIVWFGEAVPAMEEAVSVASGADIFVVIGTSLNVYPAAGLLSYAPSKASLWLIDPANIAVRAGRRCEFIKAGAGEGVKILAEKIRGL
jgi:NAD-dependent deacetylase